MLAQHAAGPSRRRLRPAPDALLSPGRFAARGFFCACDSRRKSLRGGRVTALVSGTGEDRDASTRSGLWHWRESGYGRCRRPWHSNQEAYSACNRSWQSRRERCRPCKRRWHSRTRANRRGDRPGHWREERYEARDRLWHWPIPLYERGCLVFARATDVCERSHASFANATDVCECSPSPRASATAVRALVARFSRVPQVNANTEHVSPRVPQTIVTAGPSFSPVPQTLASAGRRSFRAHGRLAGACTHLPRVPRACASPLHVSRRVATMLYGSGLRPSAAGGAQAP